MWFFWLVAALWAVVGAVFWVRDSRIIFWEWMAAAGTAFLMAIIFQVAAIKGMTHDVETLSGHVEEARYIPQWVERYTYTTTHRVGKTTVTTRHTGYHTHPERWQVKDSLGNSWDTDRTKHDELLSKFGGGTKAVRGDRTTWRTSSSLHSGDPNDYVLVNKNQYLEPVNQWHSWTNRVKAAPSAFSFPKVNPAVAGVFEYPRNEDRFRSDRLIGTAFGIGYHAWDQMNTRLGPTKHVNVIAIGFGDVSSEVAHKQRDFWIGGKKNDLVICYGGKIPTKATWAVCFGWSESDICKRNIETLFMNTPINQGIIPKLESEIMRNFQAKDWTKFDYITIEPPLWSYVLFFFVLFAVQGILYFVFMNNDMDKSHAYSRVI